MAAKGNPTVSHDVNNLETVQQMATELATFLVMKAATSEAERMDMNLDEFIRVGSNPDRRTAAIDVYDMVKAHAGTDGGIVAAIAVAGFTAGMMANSLDEEWSEAIANAVEGPELARALHALDGFMSRHPVDFDSLKRDISAAQGMNQRNPFAL